MNKLDMIRDLIEELVYENGMEWFNDYEKVDIDEERVEVYKVMEVFCVLFFVFFLRFSHAFPYNFVREVSPKIQSKYPLNLPKSFPYKFPLF